MREKQSRRETRIVNMLHFIQTSIFKSLFGRQADSLEKSREADDVCAPFKYINRNNRDFVS